jgi:hypothetical protein
MENYRLNIIFSKENMDKSNYCHKYSYIGYETRLKIVDYVI